MKTIILRDGPPGLSAGLELAPKGVQVELVDKNKQVGGLSRAI